MTAVQALHLAERKAQLAREKAAIEVRFLLRTSSRPDSLSLPWVCSRGVLTVRWLCYLRVVVLQASDDGFVSPSKFKFEM